MSEDIDPSANIWGALAKAQGQIKGAHKSADNPFFKSKFADLAECIDAIQGPASANGLSLIFDFKTEIIADNPVGWIRYRLNHSSGESYVSQWLCMFMKDKSPQGFGASCTYYKRQLLKAVYQIAEHDDDGNSQSVEAPPRPPVRNYALGANNGR